MEKELNQKIINLWKEYSEQSPNETKLWPLLFPKLKRKPEILFIGMNPSFPQKYFDDLGYTKDDFLFKNKEFDEQKELERESKAKDKSSPEKEYYKKYFGVFYKFEKENWEHVDLFFIRKTNQKKIEKINSEFAEKQANICFDAINYINPKLIVISNKLASDYFREFFKQKISDKSFDEKGFDLLELGNKEIPIFFSGMLSGQRALDTESRRRLIWQVNNILNQI